MRYSRQSILPQIGVEGQKKISAARVAIVGVGALGSVSAQLCARAGVSFLRLIDRDVVEWTNLQRQVLFTEVDARESLAKATAAKKHLGLVNSEIKIEAVIDDLNCSNVDEYLSDVDVVLDGTDNFETRYLLNDFSVKNKKPFIYGGAVGTKGMVYSVLADGRPCLKCLFPENPASAGAQTCDLVGVLASTAHVTASVQFTQLIQLIAQGEKAIRAELLSFDVWNNHFENIVANEFIEIRCEACRESRFKHLEDFSSTQALKLCGRNSVQIQSEKGHGLDWNKLASHWPSEATVQVGSDFARVHVADYELMLFKNGRVIVKGTEDVAIAKSVYARWIGC